MDANYRAIRRRKNACYGNEVKKSADCVDGQGKIKEKGGVFKGKNEG